MSKGCNRKERVTVRLNCYQMQCLKELTESLNTSYSLLIRSIIGNFLQQNEEYLERITHKHNNTYADNKYKEEN